METLLKRTKRLVRESGIPLTVICRETGLKYRWLAYVLDGTYADPSVNKIERLYQYVSERRAEKKASA